MQRDWKFYARTRDALGGQPFAAGAFVADTPGARFAADAYKRQNRDDSRVRRHACHFSVVRLGRARLIRDRLGLSRAGRLLRSFHRLRTHERSRAIRSDVRSRNVFQV